MSSITEKRDEKDINNGGVVTSETRTPARRRGCLGFLKRWWWLLLIILIIIVLVVVLPVIFVAIPKKIRSTINDATLTVQGISLLNSQSGSASLAINSTIKTGSSTSATIDPFNASFYLEDKPGHTPFMFAQMPKIHSKKTSVVNLTQEITLTDEQAFADFTSWYLMNDTFRVTVDGWTHVHVSGVPKTKVHFQKTVNLTGLNSFKGVNVTSSSLGGDALGDNFFAFADIPNPSVLTVDIGNASFATLLNTTQVGVSFIDDLILFPGTNNVSIRSEINQTIVLGAVLQEPLCNTGILPLTLLGQNISNNGQELNYFEQAFRAIPLTVDVDVAADIDPLLALAGSNLTLTCANAPELTSLLGSLLGSL